MNRLTVTCVSCGQKILMLEALPAQIEIVIELLVKLSANLHGQLFHVGGGKQIRVDVKTEAVGIDLPPPGTILKN